LSENIEITLGGCLCGAVRYELHGALRDVINCHCPMCLRFHGHYGAYTSLKEKNLSLAKDEGLQWYHSLQDDEKGNVYRGFCKDCGSSLFWRVKDSGSISIAAGTLDKAPSQMRTTMHIWASTAGDYYEITDDLPKYAEEH